MSVGEPRVTSEVKSFVTLNPVGRACVAARRAGDVDCVCRLAEVAATNSGSAVSATESPMPEAAEGAWPLAKYRLRLKLYVVVLAMVPPTLANHCVPLTVFGP